MSTPETTPERIGEFSRATTLRLAFGLIAFVVLANLILLALLTWRPVNRGTWLVREKWELLDRTEPVETLLLGDSSCNQGIRPDVLDAKLATRSLNLCTVGNALVLNDAWMLGEYIARHGAPRRVVIVHVTNAWSRELDYSSLHLLAKIPRGLGFWRELDPSLELSTSEIEDVISSRYLPLHSESTSVLTWLTSPREAMATRFTLERGGFMLVPDANPKRVAASKRGYLRELRAIKQPLSAINHRALLAIDGLARRHGFPVVILPSPYFTELWLEPDMQRHLATLRDKLHRTVGPGSPVRVVDGPPLTFPADQMENADHVVGDAARVYSEWIAEQLRAEN
ncbi:MAG: hypothetical protein KIT31_00610 [Deltaproteobacteria bacterium]|nr:hypothetical protein [Deltaproteobacteria bacterium]